jgi:hypothetical protein
MSTSVEEYEDGWYFTDEGEQLHGPFSSEAEALDEESAYFTIFVEGE